MKISYKSSSILLIFFLLNSPCKVLSLNKEGFALLSFKNSIKEDPENSFINWNSSDEVPCSWNGITCREGKVIAISFPKTGLKGTISASIGTLNYLRHINLRNNMFSGILHSDIFRAQDLQSLVLYGNFLSGFLPPEIGNLFYIQILDLSQNFLNGSVPVSLLHCKRLRILVLSHNNFTSVLPDAFGISFSALEKLDLSFNKLSGQIPGDIGSLSNLEGTLDFSHNLFSGLIPESLGNLSERVYIDLSYNNLSGPVPKNGSLVNRGLNSFIGNHGLCGPPLKIPCYPFSPPPSFAVNSNANNVSYSGKLKRSTITAIVLIDLAAICLIAMAFYLCYRKAIFSKRKEEERYFGKVSKSSKECSCFGIKENEKYSENVEQLDLIPLDKQVYFDLDELLKATAFVLGKSEIGIVYKVLLDDGLTLAVRRLGEGGSQRFKEFQREVEAIGRIRHPNIVALRAYYWSFEEKLLIYDYISDGNLTSAIHGEEESLDFSPLPWDARVKIMNGIARGLAYLHEFSPKKYVHGDIKPNNILLGVDKEPHISDFGVGRLANIASGSPAMHLNKIITEKSQNSDSSISPIVSITPSYQAPEAQKGLKPSQKWDVFSYGVILLELITAKSPLFLLETHQMDLVKWVQFCIEDRKPLLEVLDPFLAQEPEKEDEIISMLKIALACVHYNPEKRPSMSNVVESMQRLSILT